MSESESQNEVWMDTTHCKYLLHRPVCVCVCVCVCCYRLRWSGQSGHDLLPQQHAADSLHDSRVQERSLQVHSLPGTCSAAVGHVYVMSWC